jgi:hypothetical protein
MVYTFEDFHDAEVQELILGLTEKLNDFLRKTLFNSLRGRRLPVKVWIGKIGKNLKAGGQDDAEHTPPLGEAFRIKIDEE